MTVVSSIEFESDLGNACKRGSWERIELKCCLVYFCDKSLIITGSSCWSLGLGWGKLIPHLDIVKENNVLLLCMNLSSNGC